MSRFKPSTSSDRNGRVQLAVWIPRALRERLSAAAERQGRFGRHLVILALEAYLVQIEKSGEMRP